MKKFTVLVALLMTAAVLFAGGSAEKAAAPAEAGGKIELKFWSLFTGGDGEFFDAMIDAFNASQDEIVMTNDMVKFDDYYTKLTTALAARTAPDVVVVHQGNMPNYVANGALLPLDEYISQEILSDFQTAPLEACRFDGKLYSLPLDVHPIVFYYNVDILEEAGVDKVPETAQEFIDAAIKIKENTNYIPFAIDNTTGTYKAYTLTRLFFSFMAQQGGSFLNSDNTAAALNNEMGKNALVWLQDLVNKYNVNPGELDYDAAMNMFKLGEVAFYFNGVWATGTFETVEGLNFKAIPLPGIMGEPAAWAGSHTFAIPVQNQQDPAKIEAAIKFIDWMTSHGEMWAKAGHVPTRLSVVEKQEYKDLPYRSGYADAAKTALETPRTAAWEEIYGTTSDLLEKYVAENTDPQTALNEMEATVNQIIASY